MVEILKFFKIYVSRCWWVLTLRIQHKIISKICYLLLIGLLLGGGVYSFHQEHNELAQKFDYWGQKISAKNNYDGVMIQYQKGYPFINDLWNKLQRKQILSREENAFLEKKKSNSYQKFISNFKDFGDWVISNNWPRLKKIVEEMGPSVSGLDVETYPQFEALLVEKSIAMEDLISKSTLDSSIKAEIFIRIRNLKNSFNEVKALNTSAPKKIPEYDAFKKIFYESYINDLAELIEIQNKKIDFWNHTKKQFFYLIMIFSVILALRFVYTLYESNKKKSIQFSNLNTSQLIIDALYDLEEIGHWLSNKELFDIDFKKDGTLVQIKFTIGGLELDKKALHFEHTLKNGIKKSLYDIFGELKARSVKFNCCNYYKDNNEPHSFSITLDIRTSK